MDIDPRVAPELDPIAWEGLQRAVRSFREALRRGEKPAIEAYLPAGGPHRTAILLELVHEEMESRIKAGECVRVEAYLERFGDLAVDTVVAAELAAAQADLRRRSPTAAPAQPAGPDRADHPAGTSTRIDRYELGPVLGRGAFGVVHRAWDTALNRAVALKRPRPGMVETPAAVERFLREARSAARLRHPQIVAVHDVGIRDGEPYLVSALGRGPHSRRRAGRPPPRPPPLGRMDRRAGRGAGACPRPGRDPPRRQAVEYPDQPPGSRLPDRLRPGQERLGRPHADDRRPDDRHAGLHGPRADPRRARNRRCADRSLQPGSHPL